MSETIPPLTIQDLDREELLTLFAERLMFPLPQSDLWAARWIVLSRRAIEAHVRANAALSAYAAACKPIEALSLAGSFVDPLAVREAKRVEHERAALAAQQIEAACGRAREALEASRGRITA